MEKRYSAINLVDDDGNSLTLRWDPDMECVVVSINNEEQFLIGTTEDANEVFKAIKELLAV